MFKNVLLIVAVVAVTPQVVVLDGNGFISDFPATIYYRNGFGQDQEQRRIYGAWHKYTNKPKPLIFKGYEGDFVSHDIDGKEKK
jgi:hypothetical protein